MVHRALEKIRGIPLFPTGLESAGEKFHVVGKMSKNTSVRYKRGVVPLFSFKLDIL